jgi:hypothetical protein
MSPLFRALRHDFLYVTVNENDYGLEGHRGLNRDIPPNILVLSGAGRGHVPIPYHFIERGLVDPLPPVNDIVFLGRLKRGARLRIVKKYLDVFQENITIANHVRNWIDEYRQHRYILSPRGNARAAFRTIETLQMGLIPIIANERWKWVPYLNSSLDWSMVGFHTTDDEVQTLRTTLLAMDDRRVNAMRKYIRAHRESHFTLRATMRHIGKFIKTGYLESDLRCARYYPDVSFMPPRRAQGGGQAEREADVFAKAEEYAQKHGRRVVLGIEERRRRSREAGEAMRRNQTHAGASPRRTRSRSPLPS